MTTEELIERLQKLPPLYEVNAFVPGVEIDDFWSPVVDVQVDIVTKQILLEFQTKPGNERRREEIREELRKENEGKI